MTESQVRDFNKRVRTIGRKHRQLSQGYVELVERDGLLIPQKARMRRKFPTVGLLLTLAGFMLFKGFLYSQVGALHYDERINRLNDATTLEQVGAWIMQADPLTVMISSWFPKIL